MKSPTFASGFFMLSRLFGNRRFQTDAVDFQRLEARRYHLQSTTLDLLLEGLAVEGLLIGRAKVPDPSPSTGIATPQHRHDPLPRTA